jgi:arylsulfatase A-like enzyme
MMLASRPNILSIVVDDCGYADLGCTGQTDYQTPALDRLTAEGIRFTQAYANSALCTNTRVALITGRYQYRLPIGLVEPLRWSDRQWACLLVFPPCRHCWVAPVIALRLSGNGISDICRVTAP